MPSRLRVLYLGPGQSPIVRGRIAPFLGSVEACLITTEPVHRSWSDEHPTTPVHVLPRAGLRALPRWLYLHSMGYLAEVWARVARFRPDVIHVHYVSPLDALALAPVRGIPIVLTVMGGDVLAEQVARPFALDRAVRALFARAAAVTAKSRFLAERCHALGAPCGRVHLVPWGVETARFSLRDRAQARRSLGLEGEGQILLSSRALRPLYNHEFVVEATAQLGQGGATPTLVFTRNAEDPGYARRVASRARALGVEARFLEPLSAARMPDLYAAADACVSVPASDGLPQTLLEALACGRPTVVLDLPAYRELPFAADAMLRVGHWGGTPRPEALREGLRDALAQRERAGLASARAWIEESAELARSVAAVRAIYEAVR